jgi:ADP-ribose pyrophosphatase
MAELPEVLLVTRRFRVVRKPEPARGAAFRTREIIEHPGAAAILPLLSDDRIVLIENYRLSVDRRLLEIPAGTLEPGEEPSEAALRELAEETGYRAGSLELWMSFYPSPGILTERMYLYAATDLAPGPTALEADEDIRVRIVAADEAIDLIGRGEIEDAKTIAGLLFWHAFRRKRA